MLLRCALAFALVFSLFLGVQPIAIAEEDSPAQTSVEGQNQIKDLVPDDTQLSQDDPSSISDEISSSQTDIAESLDKDESTLGFIDNAADPSSAATGFDEAGLVAQSGGDIVTADSGNNPSTVSDIAIYWRSVDEGWPSDDAPVLFDPLDSETYPTIWPGRSIRLSATITLSTGDVKFIPEQSDLWKWEATKYYDASGVETQKANILFDSKENMIVGEGVGSAEANLTLLQFPDYVLATPLKVKVTETPADKVYPKSVTLSYTDTQHTVPTPWVNTNQPTIASGAESVQCFAAINYSDGTTRSVVPSHEAGGDLACAWKIDSVVDWSGNAVASPTASVSEDGLVYVQGTGNALANISFSLLNHPEVSASAQVRILLNTVEKYPVAVKLYDDVTRIHEVGMFDTLVINQRRGMVALYPQLIYNDGSVANPTRDEYRFSIVRTTDLSGQDTTSSLITCNQSGIMRANVLGNGYVMVACSVAGSSGISAQTRICVLQNTPDLMSLDLSFVDDLHPGGAVYNEDEGLIPQIREHNGNIQLVPHVVLTTGAEGTPSSQGLTTSWSITDTTSLDGEPLSGQDIATVENGYVFATGIGNGVVYVKCTINERPDFNFTARVEVRGNGEPWVSKVEILNRYGVAYGDDSEDLDSFSPVQFHARVTYSDGTVKNTFYGDVIPGLRWGADSLYGATIDPYTGQMVFEETFHKARVQATVQGGGFYGQDISRSVYVFYDAGVSEDIDNHSDSLTIRVVYESDYRNDRDAANAVYEKKYDASYLSGMAQSCSYTFSKGPSSVNGAFNTRNYGVLFARGVPIDNLITEAGCTSDDMVAFRFLTPDAYNPKAFSASEVLGTRYAYPNFTIGVEKGNPSAAGAVPVPTMLALTSYIKLGGDINDTVMESGNMSNATQFRLCMGLTSTLDSNSFESAKYVSTVILIVKDASYNYDNNGGSGGGTGGGNGSGSGTGTGDGAGTGIGTGAGIGTGSGITLGTGETTENGGVGTKAVAAGTSSVAEGGGSGGGGTSMTLREIQSLDPGNYVLEDNTVSITTLIILGVLMALVAGGLKTEASFRRRLSAGLHMMQRIQKEGIHA